MHDGDHAYRLVRQLLRYTDPKGGNGAGGTTPTCLTPTRRFRLTATLPARPAWPKCCCKATWAKCTCCRPCLRPGRRAACAA
ncbi:hypothetical protein [Hymenobacter sp. AT01-02]|uniref:hypothetical protein n=1 Tax=Hymenobacter sp. AT01-02 TaxID=1571877 RepID=UPI0039778067